MAPFLGRVIDMLQKFGWYTLVVLAVVLLCIQAWMYIGLFVGILTMKNV